MTSDRYIALAGAHGKKLTKKKKKKTERKRYITFMPSNDSVKRLPIDIITSVSLQRPACVGFVYIIYYHFALLKCLY